jgi:putative hemolysin
VANVTDIIEGVVGTLPDNPARDAGPIVERAEGGWLVDGAISLEDLRAALPIPVVSGDEQGRYHTLAGLIMTRLATVPRTGDRVDWGDFRFEVVDMDGRRVDKVLVTRRNPEDARPASIPHGDSDA